MLVVYLSNKSIKVVKGTASKGKITVQGLYQMEDNGGTILNGTIVDREALKSLLWELWNGNNLPKKDVYLVINSNQITMRMLEMPVMKERETLDYIARELAGLDRIVDPVYGYFGLEKAGKLQKIFATAAPREYLQQFQALFKEIGVDLSGIESVKASMIQLVGVIPQLQGKTAAVQFIDHMNLTNVLMVDGKYRNFNDKRLFSDPGTPGFSVEAARAISELMQFAKTQSIETPITNVYVAGINEEDYPVYEESVGRIDPGLQTDSLQASNVQIPGGGQAGRAFSDYALAIGGLLQDKDTVNMLQQMKVSPEEVARRKLIVKVSIPSVIGLIAVIGLFVLLLKQNGQYKSQLAQLQEYNNSQEVNDACKAYDEIGLLAGQIAGQTASVRSFVDIYQEYPKVDRKLLEQMKSQAGSKVQMEITGFKAETGALNFSCSAADVEDINSFVDSLERTGVMTNLQYTGYEYMDALEYWNVAITGLVTPAKVEKQNAE